MVGWLGMPVTVFTNTTLADRPYSDVVKPRPSQPCLVQEDIELHEVAVLSCYTRLVDQRRIYVLITDRISVARSEHS